MGRGKVKLFGLPLFSISSSFNCLISEEAGNCITFNSGTCEIYLKLPHAVIPKFASIAFSKIPLGGFNFQIESCQLFGNVFFYYFEIYI